MQPISLGVKNKRQYSLSSLEALWVSVQGSASKIEDKVEWSTASSSLPPKHSKRPYSLSSLETLWLTVQGSASKVEDKVEWTTASSSLPSQRPYSLSSLEALWMSVRGSTSESTMMNFAEKKESISWFSKRSGRSNRKPFQAQQDTDFDHRDLALLPPPHFESQSSYEDLVGRNYRRARSEKRDQASARQRQRRGSRRRWSRARGKAFSCQIRGDITTTLEAGHPASPPAGKRVSCESVGERHPSKPPKDPEGHEVSTQEGTQASERETHTQVVLAQEEKDEAPGQAFISLLCMLICMLTSWVLHPSRLTGGVI
nr:uncharacterized protein LOC132764915 [Anolis sagrei ordinatus]